MSINSTLLEEKSAKTKQSLVDSASELFVKYGVNKVTIDDICSNCGMTKGSFYYHFPSKNHIVALSINSGLDRYLEEHYNSDENLSITEQLTNLNLCTFNFFQKIGKELTGLSFISLISTLVDVVIKDRTFVNVLSSIIIKAQNQSLLNDMNKEEAYHHCSSVINGILIEWCISGDKLNNIDWKKLIKIKSKSSLENNYIIE